MAANAQRKCLRKRMAVAAVLNKANKNEIAHQYNVYSTTVTCWIEKFKENGTLQRRAGSGRPKVSTEKQDNALRDVLVANSTSAIQHAIVDTNLPGCINTARQ